MYFATKLLVSIAVATVVSASTEFPYASPSDCITSCTVQAGKQCFAQYTEDSTSVDFIQSLACLCDGDAKTTAFLDSSSKCFVASKCTSKDISLAKNLEAPICNWYNAHKSDHKPTESPKSTANASAKSAESSKSTASDRPTESAKSTVNDKSTETHKPSASDKSSESPKSTASEKSSETHKPTASDKSSEAHKPTDSEKSTESHKTATSDKSTETAKPTRAC
ncbi:hypothetical protein K7432_015551 [Basidiobolus ranarum]|uniref:Extracellular membrane protein CFEM domain-containing protein n=1 Tax=Basidiobolus ranarum TaxID=34480 RepID=A0ABR2WFW4_9FUNG